LSSISRKASTVQWKWIYPNPQANYALPELCVPISLLLIRNMKGVGLTFLVIMFQAKKMSKNIPGIRISAVLII
jgi:hypothetical protein